MERSTAFILWLSACDNKQITKPQSEFAPNYIEIENKKISRINTIAIITQKHQKDNFASITLDDGSAQIRAKAWNDDIKIMNDIKIGDIVLVIGKLKEYNDELYISPEIIKQQSYHSLLLRQLSLFKEQGKPLKMIEQESPDFLNQDNFQLKEEKIYSESRRQKILGIIASIDTEIGASINQVIASSGFDEQEASNIINELLQEGEIFKISNDRIKIT